MPIPLPVTTVDDPGATQNFEKLASSVVSSASSGSVGSPAGGESLSMLRGIINTTTPTITEGLGFSVARNGTGDVTITFDTAFSDVPAVVCSAMPATGATTQFTAAPRNADEVTASTVRILRWDSAFGGGASDGTFHFQAIGPT